MLSWSDVIQIAPAGKLFDSDSEQFFDTDKTIVKPAEDHTKHTLIDSKSMEMFNIKTGRQHLMWYVNLIFTNLRNFY